MRAYHEAESVPDIIERLSMPIPETGCHEWLGKIGTGGYAYISYREDGQRFHRKAATVVYELYRGPVPEGLEISHICPGGGNPACVNPDHIIAETHSENLKRRRKFPRYKGNVCKQGHSLADGVRRASNGGCFICEQARAAAWREKNPTANRDYLRANRDRLNARRRERRRQLQEST